MTTKEYIAERFAGMDQDDIYAELEEMMEQGGCEAACEHDCWIEPDGTCEHGRPSILIVMGLI